MIKNYSPVAGLELSLGLDDNKYESFFTPPSFCLISD